MASERRDLNEALEANEGIVPPVRSRARGIPFRILIPAIVAILVVTYIVFPPFPKGEPGAYCAYPVCFINSTVEFPPPAVVFGQNPADAGMIFFAFSISSTLLTLWIVMAILIVVVRLATWGMKLAPGRFQNGVEFAYEALANFGESLGGVAARPYIPIFAAFFLLILLCNWSGLIPPVGRLDQLRAPTSDVNITIGLALVSFIYFEWQGFARLGVRGYLGKFFPFGEFRNGFTDGLIAMFVGFIELFLEFVKPVTLSMRLFGNIYGGEVAVAVILSLTIAFVPVLIYGLEFMLNFIQALIFSVLTLMFTLIAIEGHTSEGHAGRGDVEHQLAQDVTSVADGNPQTKAA